MTSDLEQRAIGRAIPYAIAGVLLVVAAACALLQAAALPALQDHFTALYPEAADLVARLTDLGSVALIAFGVAALLGVVAAARISYTRVWGREAVALGWAMATLVLASVVIAIAAFSLLSGSAYDNPGIALSLLVLIALGLVLLGILVGVLVRRSPRPPSP